VTQHYPSHASSNGASEEPAGAPSTAVRVALHRAILEQLHGELGWSEADANARAVQEERRRLARGLVRRVTERHGWSLRDARILDVGAGYGAVLQELLAAKADAYGIDIDDRSLSIAALRLSDAGFEGARVTKAAGEQLPFREHAFDYVISLQVLEHVRDPSLVIREIFRVLRPGGRCFIGCENYLSFHEPEYRVFWLPLLPKRLGAWYLRRLGRNPDFLIKHIHYTTYPQISRLCARVGFINETYTPYLPGTLRRGRPLQPLLRKLVFAVGHVMNCFRIGVRVYLRKPTAE
jgi:ubiquinone/menaquinone biosynthesis C-methylase UbiE